ncbi:MAG: hypothetical protein J5706_06835 [Elusimicrobiales bacterium]|nr:hypothetical protein [Elusimicrobiales bacterium]
MGQKPRNKMPIKERAKQFAPFAAIRGLEAALKRKEQELLLRQSRTGQPEENASNEE